MIDIPLPHLSLYVYDDKLYGGMVIASQWLVESNDPSGEGSQILALLLARFPPYYRLMVLTYVVEQTVKTLEYPDALDVMISEVGTYTGWLLEDEEPVEFRNIIEAVKAYENY